MRPAACVIALALVGLAVTTPARPTRADDRVADAVDPATARPEDPPFWDWLLEPHATEIAVVLQKVAEQRRRIADNGFPHYDTGGWSRSNATARALLCNDLEGMLRWALGLAPRHIELRRDLALLLADAGKPGAEAALAAYLADELPDRPTGDARTRLAMILASRGEIPDAIAELRLALGGGFIDSSGRTRTQAILLLAQTLMTDGRLAEAIDLLETAIATGIYSSSYGPGLQIQFARAVAYDRDEQVSRAHAAIEQIVTLGPDAMQSTLIDSMGNPMPFMPPSERTYWNALQLEALGHLPEALTEWASYARLPEARYAERAREHAHAVERLIEQGVAEARRARKHPPSPPVPLVPTPGP